MQICYFGIYGSWYARNAVLISGLKKNGAEVIECNVNDRERFKNWKLFREYFRIGRKCDVMVVGFSGHTIMPLAWALTRFPRKKIILDGFTSWYDANILDRKKHSVMSPAAIKYWAVDWLAFHLADVVLFDSRAHCRYISDKFNLRKDKLKAILVGCPDDVIHPMSQQKKIKDFLVHFHGTYIPVQGVPYIIEAAGHLRDEGVVFNIIGKLGTYKEAISLAEKLKLKNVNFIDFMPYATLAEYMASADICLGMFGTSARAMYCGAFKVVEGLAMGKAVVTARTPAMEEFLVDRESVLFSKIGNSRDLADKILELKNNLELRNKVAENGYKVYQAKLRPEVLGR